MSAEAVPLPEPGPEPDRAVAAPVEHVRARAYTVPTDAPESDGTLAWDRTTLVLAEVTAGGETGLGYTYTDAAAARLVDGPLAEAVRGRAALDVRAAWDAMRRALRNVPLAGLATCAVSAVDAALWDLKGRLLGRPAVVLLDAAREAVPAYGSGGFTSYPVERLRAQLAGWAEAGLHAVKMKVGREPERDLVRVRAAREAVGEGVGLFVDANGAYTVRQAQAFAGAFADLGVTWFEEPVPSADLDGLARVRERTPAGLEVTAGEYEGGPTAFRRMLDARAVDVLMADATRCGGLTGFAAVGPLCEAHRTPLSAHTAPTLHAHAGCASGPCRHVEFFHDHARVERLLFDGALAPDPDGRLRPDRQRPGLGVALKEADAARYLVYRTDG